MKAEPASETLRFDYKSTIVKVLKGIWTITLQFPILTMFVIVDLQPVLHA